MLVILTELRLTSSINERVHRLTEPSEPHRCSDRDETPQIPDERAQVEFAFGDISQLEFDSSLKGVLVGACIRQLRTMTYFGSITPYVPTL